MRFQNVCWLILCLVFLSACNNGTDTPTAELTLTADPTQVTSGGTTTLTATIDEGADNVALVEFAVKDQAAFFTDDNAEGGYTAASAALTTDTIFVATAKDEDGTTLGTSETTVTVTAPVNQPNAEPKTVTTLAGVQVVGGRASTGLAVRTERLVVENGTARVKEGTETGGTATVAANGNFTFTPASGATSGSFEYEVVSDVAGTTPDSAVVTITITALPANTAIVDTFAALETATATGSTVETIIVSGTIVCEEDPCAGLEAGQKLIGSGTVGDITLVNPGAKLDATRPGDESTPPENNNITVVELAANSSVEELEISGRDIYTAINGSAINFDTDPAPGVITPSAANIKNVTIIGPTSNAPLAMRLDTAPVGSYYDLTIDGLEVTNATNTIGLNAFNTLTFTNSTIAMNITSNTRGLFIAAEGASTAVIDNVDIASEVAGETFTPMFIANGSGGGTLTVTVKNSDITFPDATPAELAVARSFGFDYENNEVPPREGKIAIQTAESTTNTSEGDGAVTYEAETPNDATIKVTGYIQGNKPSVFITR